MLGRCLRRRLLRSSAPGVGARSERPWRPLEPFCEAAGAGAGCPAGWVSAAAMRRRGHEEEACGVWLDAAALKRRRVQVGCGGVRGCRRRGERPGRLRYPGRREAVEV